LLVSSLVKSQDVIRENADLGNTNSMVSQKNEFWDALPIQEDSAKYLRKIKVKLRLAQTLSLAGAIFVSLSLDTHRSLDAQSNLGGTGLYAGVLGVILWYHYEKKYYSYLNDWQVPGRRKMIWGRFFIYGGIFVLTETALSTIYSDQSPFNSGIGVMVETIFIGGGAALLTSGILLRKKGMEKYNSSKNHAVSLELIPRINGLGLRLRF